MGITSLSSASLLLAIVASILAAIRMSDRACRVQSTLFLSLSLALAVRSLAVLWLAIGAPPASVAALVPEGAALLSALFLLLTLIVSRDQRAAATNFPRADEAAQLRAVLDHTPDSIFVKDRDGRYLFLNAAWSRATGRGAEHSRGQRDEQLWDPETARTFVAEDARVLAGETLTVEEVLHRPHGPTVYLTTKAPLRSADGSILGIVGIAHDITDRKRAEIERLELEIAMENAMPCIARMDANGCYVTANAAYAQVLGCRPNELLGRPASETVHPDDHPLLDGMLRAFARTGRAEGELRGVRADGSIFHKHVLIVRSQNSHVADRYCFMRDITQRKLTEEQHVRTQKLEAAGRLAGLLAHDLNNALMTILGHAEIVTQRLHSALDDADPAFGSMKRIDGAASQAAELGRRLSAFSRQSVHQPRRLDPAQLVRNLAPALQSLAGVAIDVRLSYATENARIQFDAVQFEQVLTILVGNARDAMPNGGTLRVDLELIHRPDARSSAGGALPGRALQIAVADTGVGMTGEVMRHLFEPFFSTKPLGRGAGLGLATVQSIVSHGGGAIEVSSEPGRGASFRVHLPAYAGEAAPPAAELGLPQVDAGGATILVCEGDTDVRDLTCRVLEDAGYFVLAAADGREALRTLQTSGRRPHLLVTEMMLPDLNGRQLAGLVRGMCPMIEVLFVSGFSALGLTDSGAIDGSMNLLEKPFDRATLIDRVQSLVRANRRTSAAAAPRSR